MGEPAPLTLKQRIFKAGVWTLAGFGLSQLIRFGSNLLMTRLLVPDMYGVMAIAQMILYGLALFSDVGLGQNIVQSKRGNEAAFLNTAWIIQILRGTLIWFFALAAALFVALANRIGFFPADGVYANPDLPSVIAILSASAVISGFDSSKLFEASRNLVLDRITKIEITSQIVGLLCMFGWVAVDRSIWALVAGSLCAVLARTILSHLWLLGVTNRWQWDSAAFREIIHFGKWIFLSSILGFLARSGDRLLLGWWLSTSALGAYAIAFLIFSSIETVLTKIINDVAFPALGEITRERPAHLKTNYYRFHVPIAALAYGCSGFLMTSGQTLVGLLYDQRYVQTGWMLEILAAAFLTIPFRIAMQCFMALGMSKLFSHIIAIQVFTLFIFTPVGFNYFGIQGALWGLVLSYFSSLPMIVFYMVKYGLFNLRKELLLIPAIPAGMILGRIISMAVGY